MDKKSFLKSFTRNLVIVGFVSLFTDLSSQMVFPLIPLYLVSIWTDVAELFIENKTKEWDRYMAEITDLDYQFYFHC